MISLTRRLSKKTGIKRKDLDALLKAIGYEIVENLKAYHRFEYPNLGIFYCNIKNGKMTVKISLNSEAYERLNKIEEGEQPNEIVFE
jgi:nucleoid DNA-binding protein